MNIQLIVRKYGYIDIRDGCNIRYVRDQMCGDKSEMLMTDLIHWENQQDNEKSRQHNDSATNIWNQ